MSRITAVISDFGGVLTTPLEHAFTAFQERSGVPLAALGRAMAAITERDGANPLFELETGRLSEAGFLGALGDELSSALGRPVDMSDFSQGYFEDLAPNRELIDYMRALRERGYRMAICTNNVREWDARWRAMLPVDEIFDVVVDSAFVGARKPEREIYTITLTRLGVAADAALFVDDVEINCDAARELGIRSVWFRSTEQAIEEIETALRDSA